VKYKIIANNDRSIVWIGTPFKHIKAKNIPIFKSLIVA